MIFFNLIFKNLFRNPKKFLLTVFGISLIFFLLIFPLINLEVSKISFDETCTIFGDFIVEKKIDNNSVGFALDGVMVDSDHYFINQNFLNSYSDYLNRVSGVVDLFYIISDFDNIGELGDAYVNVYYVNSSDLANLKINMVGGEFFSDSSHCLVEKSFADSNNIHVGDSFTVKSEIYKVSGIFKGNDYFLNGVILPLNSFQYLNSFSLSELNNFNYIVTNDVNSSVTIDKSNGTLDESQKVIFIGKWKDISFKDQIKKDIDSIDSHWICENSLNNSQDYHIFSKYNNMLNFLIQSLVLVLSQLIFIYNFMTSIDDKIKDLAILKSIGWSDKNLIIFLLSESLLIVIIAGIIVWFSSLLLVDHIIYFKGVILNFNIAFSFFALVFICGLISSIYYLCKLFKLDIPKILKS